MNTPKHAQSEARPGDTITSLLAEVDALNDEVNEWITKDKINNGYAYSLFGKQEQTISLLTAQIWNLEDGLYKIIEEAPGHGEDRSYLTAKETLKHKFDERKREVAA